MFTHYEKVRLLDINSGGHLSNEKLQSYLTECNDCYFRSLGYSISDFFGTTPVVSNIVINFKKPVFYPDTLKIELDIEEISNLSFTCAYKIFNQEQKLTHTATVKLVMVSNETHKPVKINDEIRAVLSK